jgi:AraC-like DNA-binding protein
MDRRHFFLHETRMSAEPQARTVFVENLHVLPDARWDGAVVRVPRAGHVICGPEYTVARAASPGYDLLFCTSGRGRILTGGRSITVDAGSFAAIDGQSTHGHAADPSDPWTLYWLRIDGPQVAAALAGLFGPSGGVIPISRGVALQGWFTRLFAAIRGRGPNLDLTLNQLVAELWSLLNAELLALSDQRLPAPVERLTAAMSARPAAPWSAVDMQRVAAISPAQLRRHFRTHLKTTPREWLRRERVLLAKDLLLRPGARVALVAEACGFSDIYHFSREFRRTVGQSPTAWRRAEVGQPLPHASKGRTAS